MSEKDDAIVAVFKTIARKNTAKSLKEGRPIYDEIEVCEIRFAADRNRVVVQPAHKVWKWQVSPEGGREPVTYAMRFAAQYQRFREKRTQVKEGTPLEEAPFLSQAKRLELKALNVHTVEMLAGLDGQPLKNLGVGGRELKNQAAAYLEAASGSAAATSAAAENAALKQTVDELKRQIDELQASVSPADRDDNDKSGGTSQADLFVCKSDKELREFIKERSGAWPRGNPSRPTLVAMATELIGEERQTTEAA